MQRDVAKVYAMASFDHVLYVALRTGDGDFLVDAVDVGVPAAPALLDTVSLGNMADDPTIFSSVSLHALDGVLLLQTRDGLRTLRLDPAGRLEPLGFFELGASTHEGSMGRLSLGGRFASHRQFVVEPGSLGAVPRELYFQDVLIDLTDPEQPFLVRSAPQLPGMAGLLMTPEPVNGELRGEPVSVSHDPFGNTASVVSFHRRLDDHLRDFWESKLEAVIEPAALDSHLGEVVDGVVTGLNTQAMHEETIDLFLAANDLNGLDLRALIYLNHHDSEDLASVLGGLGIDMDESLHLAVEKVIHRGLDRDLEAEIAVRLYQPVLLSWLQTLLRPNLTGRSLGAVEAELTAAMNAEVQEAGLERYVVERLFAPLLGNPAYASWTLDELIASIADSAPGEAIDTLLTTFGVATAGDLLDDIDLWVPGDPFPDCARFPGSTSELLELALYSGGAGLDPQGPAWFELLKYNQYVTVGGRQHDDFLADVEVELGATHARLATDLVRKLSTGIGSEADPEITVAEHLRAFASRIPARRLVSASVASSLIEMLRPTGLHSRMTVREAMQAWSLPVDVYGDPMGTIGDLVGALDRHRVGDLLVQAPFDIARNRSADLERELVHALQRHIRASFGEYAPERTVRQTMTTFVSNQMELSRSLGELSLVLVDGLARQGYGIGSYVSTMPIRMLHNRARSGRVTSTHGAMRRAGRRAA